MTEHEVIDEVIRLTTWRQIRRYVILGGLGFVVLDLIITLSVVIALSISTRQDSQDRAQHSCKVSSALAKDQRITVKEAKRSTTDLAKSGNTLGLGRKKFDKLVKQSNAQADARLRRLDRIATQDCARV